MKNVRFSRSFGAVLP